MLPCRWITRIALLLCAVVVGIGCAEAAQPQETAPTLPAAEDETMWTEEDFAQFAPTAFVYDGPPRPVAPSPYVLASQREDIAWLNEQVNRFVMEVALEKLKDPEHFASNNTYSEMLHELETTGVGPIYTWPYSTYYQFLVMLKENGIIDNANPTEEHKLPGEKDISEADAVEISHKAIIESGRRTEEELEKYYICTRFMYIKSTKKALWVVRATPHRDIMLSNQGNIR